jgi:hypothetical protein
LVNTVELNVRTVVCFLSLHPFRWLLLIPVVGNASEHAIACAIGLRSFLGGKANLAIGVMIGTAIQINLLTARATVPHHLRTILSLALWPFRCITVYFRCRPSPTSNRPLPKQQIMEVNFTHVWDLSPGVRYVDKPLGQRTVYWPDRLGHAVPSSPGCALAAGCKRSVFRVQGQRVQEIHVPAGGSAKSSW